MELVHERSYGSIKRSVKVIDGPVMSHPSSSTGKKIRVQHLSITFTLRNGEWIIDSWSAVAFGGPVLKKDGTEGRETWGGNVHYSWDKMTEYNWVRKVIDAVRPEGAPVLPFRLSGLELEDDLNG
jgi:hypothetical protein